MRGVIIAIVVLLGLGTAAWFALAPKDRPPHVILISIDSLRPDRLSCYGAKRDTSPTIDALAEGGVVFDNAISTTSWTLPSHSAMFTALPDRVHGCYFDTKWLDGSRQTVAEAFGAAGYRTTGFFSGPYLHPGFGLSQGFDEYHDCTSYSSKTIEALRNKEVPSGWMDRAHADVTNPIIADALKAWVDRRTEEGDERPTFTFLHLWDVHYDYIAPKRFRDRYVSPSYQGDVDGTKVIDLMRRPKHWTPADEAHLLSLYDAEIRWTDETIRRILDTLRAGGLLDNAIVAIVADHGEAFYEHTVHGHRHTLFDVEIRIPWIIHAPGRVAEGRRLDTPVSLIDVAPTLLDLAGVAPLPHAFGRSTRTLITPKRDDAPAPDDEAWKRELYAELVLPGIRHHFAIRTPEWKLMVDVESGDMFVFDLVQDPTESRPLPARDFPKRRAEFEERYRNAVRTLDQWTKKLPLPGERDTPRIDKMTEQQLRRLGYLR